MEKRGSGSHIFKADPRTPLGQSGCLLSPPLRDSLRSNSHKHGRWFPNGNGTGATRKDPPPKEISAAAAAACCVFAVTLSSSDCKGSCSNRANVHEQPLVSGSHLQCWCAWYSRPPPPEFPGVVCGSPGYPRPWGAAAGSAGSGISR